MDRVYEIKTVTAAIKEQCLYVSFFAHFIKNYLPFKNNNITIKKQFDSNNIFIIFLPVKLIILVKMSYLCKYLFLFCFFPGLILSQNHLTAVAVETSLDIDGNINEKEWLEADSADNFIQIEPDNGEAAECKTIGRVLYNSEFLFIGGTCYFKKSDEEIRVLDLKRDFIFSESDGFGVILDLFSDKRNATAFFINPLGVQRDEMVFDEKIFDQNWDTKWYAETNIRNFGWTFEIAIPWSSIRYSPNADSFGINFVRLGRKSNELSAWVPFPRTYTIFRLEYEGILKGIQPPLPHNQIKLIPYLLMQNNFSKTETTRSEFNKFKPGGDVKWALNSSTILDITVNTDFAQADADRDIINLTSFDISLPEQRQFFLESAGLFKAGNAEGIIEPFFSRRIGIDDNNNPVPLDGGLRLVHRDIKRSYGVLAALTHIPDSTPEGQPESALQKNLFLIGRYSQNYDTQSRFGFLTTYRGDYFSRGDNHNLVSVADGLIRFYDNLSFSWMVSGSHYVLYDKKKYYGYSHQAALNYLTEDIHLYLKNYLITRDYFAESGFVTAKNITAMETGTDLYLRPAWKPELIRDFEPGFYINHYSNINDGKLRQFYFTIWPVYILFQNGMVISSKWIPTWENLHEEFIPSKGVVIGRGNYFYNRYEFNLTSDPSASINYSFIYSTGSYFNGRLNKLRSKIKYAPIPHISVSFNYEPNWINSIGILNTNKKIEIISTELNLALNTKVGLTGFYQFNSENKTSFTSLRFSWEYFPLSYLFILYNYGRTDNILEISDQNQLLIKLSYQFQL